MGLVDTARIGGAYISVLLKTLRRGIKLLIRRGHPVASQIAPFCTTQFK